MSTLVEAEAQIGGFTARAEAVGAKVERAACRQEALELVESLLRQHGVNDNPDCCAVWSPSAMVSVQDRIALEAAVPGLTFAVTRELAAQAKVGISQMDWGIADTGTLVQCADQVATRLVSSLPETHIALLSTASLVPDLAAAVACIDPDRCAYLSFITGPSRTADIERVLTIGVHGPGKLIIILVDNLEAAS